LVAGFQVENRGCAGGDPEEKEGREAAWGHHQHPQAMVAGALQVAIPHGECIVAFMHACNQPSAYTDGVVWSPFLAVLHIISSFLMKLAGIP
jgi:hypothetical protein